MKTLTIKIIKNIRNINENNIRENENISAGEVVM